MTKNIIIFVLFLSLSGGAFVATNIISGLKGTIAVLTIKHKKQLVKTKVKERGKRLLATVPIVGVVAVGWFEKQEYDEWKAENPGGSVDEYTNEIINATSEVADEIVDSYCKDIGEFCESFKKRIQDD